jgi:hypothetical protein
MNYNHSWLKSIPLNIGSYISGFVDGEGSFIVSLRKREDHSLGWQVVLTLNVAQRDKTVLALIKHHIGCGKLHERKDGVWYYAVSNPNAIQEKIIPFFKKFPFLSSSKKRNFSIFSQVAEMVFKKEHLSNKGMLGVIKLREKLNKGRGRKRKYNIEDYKQSLSENPQRLHARPQPRKRVWMI